MMKKIKVAIVGATGYTGSELFRILYTHPDVEIVSISSDSRAGEDFSSVQPQFAGTNAPALIPHNQVPSTDPDLVFLALPHGVSMEFVQKWFELDFKIIDLSGDFRLSGPETYQEWYHQEHSFVKGFEHAVYGLPELHAASIKNTKLLANPGCFTSTSILGLAPLMARQLVQADQIIIDGKTGVTGAGAKARPNTHFPVVNENFLPYGIKNHRHTIEIEEQCAFLYNQKVTVQFTPHLLPVDRGILASIYARPLTTMTQRELKEIYLDFYKDAPFIRVVDFLPSLKGVRGTNFCDLHVDVDERTGNVLVFSALDNLMKGAAGVAVQNMNLMCGLPETTGLMSLALQP